MWYKIAICLAVSSSLNIIHAQQSQPNRKLNFDNGERIEGKVQPQIVSSGQKLFATIDPGTVLGSAPQIVSSDCYSPPACLKVSMAPSAPNSKKNKILFNVWSHHKIVPGGKDGIIRINDNRETNIRFAMKLGQHYSTPIHSLLHFQVSQTLNNKSLSANMSYVPAGPVLSINIVPLSRRAIKNPEYQEFVLSIRYPGANKFKFYDLRDSSVIYRGKVKVGDWNRFRVSFTFKPSGDQPNGNLKFFLNGKQKVAYNGPIGFSPQKFGSSDTLGIDLGIYRTPDRTGRQIVYFDDVEIWRSTK
ncbi:hypothetical protein [Sphingobium sp. MK2]|uniref:hypothetical protein n=1 Tax=Sphingobium sp. MK2 TaxID=3116540 RepID=UPI0032E36468